MNIGERIGDYEIVEILGAGGMGQVYKVRNVLSERIEAMKVLLPNLEGDPGLADRFLREIKMQAALRSSEHRQAVHRHARGRSAADVHGICRRRLRRQQLEKDGAPCPAKRVGFHRRRCSTRWLTRTGAAWCIATSSPPTS